MFDGNTGKRKNCNGTKRAATKVGRSGRTVSVKNGNVRAPTRIDYSFGRRVKRLESRQGTKWHPRECWAWEHLSSGGGVITEVGALRKENREERRNGPLG